MGEIADAMINGEMCDLCGCYFFNPEDNKPLLPDGYPVGPKVTIYEHGHPATCWDCWGSLSKKDKHHHQRAQFPTL